MLLTEQIGLSKILYDWCHIKLYDDSIFFAYFCPNGVKASLPIMHWSIHSDFIIWKATKRVGQGVDLWRSYFCHLWTRPVVQKLYKICIVLTNFYYPIERYFWAYFLFGNKLQNDNCVCLLACSLSAISIFLFIPLFFYASYTSLVFQPDFVSYIIYLCNIIIHLLLNLSAQFPSNSNFDLCADAPAVTQNGTIQRHGNEIRFRACSGGRLRLEMARDLATTP